MISFVFAGLLALSGFFKACFVFCSCKVLSLLTVISGACVDGKLTKLTQLNAHNPKLYSQICNYCGSLFFTQENSDK
jgi:hypothetical protein